MMKTPIQTFMRFMLALLLVLLAATGRADDLLKPYLLISNTAMDLQQAVAPVRTALEKGGIEIVGEYSPYADAYVMAITSSDLKKAASKSEFGGFGAAQRITFTKIDGKIQVARNNPMYMANAYRMDEESMKVVADKLNKILGEGTPFGAKGLTAERLRNYQYKMFMPYFDEPVKIAKFKNHTAAMKAVEDGLSKKAGGLFKVYRIDVKKKSDAVFGVGMTNGCSADEHIMGKIDFNELRSTPHLPYEILVSGEEVYIQHAKFRIAQSFPDLGMIGSRSFFSIMCAPGAIESAVREAVGPGIREANAYEGAYDF